MSHPSAGKLLLTVFWDSQGPNLQHFMETGIKCKLQQHAKKWTEISYSHKPERKVVTRCCCYTTVHTFILHTSPSTPFKNQSGKLLSIQPAAPAWPLPIFISLDPWRTLRGL